MTRTPFLPLLLSCSILLVGCARTVPSTSTPHAVLAGVVHGGQQPVSGATIQLYAVGTTGDGSAATPLIATPPTTDAGGSFNITSAYTCPSGSPQVYIVATGGNPGLGAGGSNPQIALMAALGRCGSYGPASFININELTTVAGVYALAPFMTSVTSVGSGYADTASLASAFTLANELVNIGAGTAPGTNVPSGLTVPIAQVNTIADIASSCINSPGGVSGDTSLCGQFFAMTQPSGGTTSTNTISALLNLANNPALNTPQLYALAATAPPFQPTDSAPPPDLSIDLTPAAPSVLTFSTPQLYVPSGGTSIITLTNSGATSISISSFAASTGFSQTNTCGASLALSATCAVTVSAATTTQTPFNGTLTASTSASPTAQVVNLVTAQNVYNFGTSTVGYPANNSYPDSCSLIGVEDYCEAEPTLGGTDFGDFPSTGLCVAHGGLGACTAYVNFVPTAVGQRFATFRDTAAGTNNPYKPPYLFVGYGIPSTGQVISYSTSTATLNLGTAVGSGTNTPPASMTLTNTGNQPVNLSISISGQYDNAPPYPVFSETTTCDGSLAIGATCTITVTGTAYNLGGFGGLLTITSNSLTPYVTIPVGGTIASPAPALSLSSKSVSLASVPVGTKSTAQTVTVTNTGNVALSLAVGPYTTNNAYFTYSTTCGNSLAVAASCTITVNGTPPAAGPIGANLVVAAYGLSEQFIQVSVFGQ